MCLDALYRCVQIFGRSLTGTCWRSDCSVCPQREPLTDITNQSVTVEPATEQPRAVRRRLNLTPIPEARTSDIELLRQALYFIYTVEKYATEYRVAPLLDMLEAFKADCGALGRRRTVPPARQADQDAGREAHARPAVH